MLRRQFFGAGLFALLGFGILGGGGTAMAEEKAYMPIWTNGTPGTIVVTDPKYGAYGDGVHDDTAAIQAAIDAGTDIYLPAGTYLLNPSGANGKALDIATAGTRLRGAGRDVTTIRLANTALDLLHIDADFCAVEGLTLDTQTDNAQAAVVIVANNTRLYRSRFLGGSNVFCIYFAGPAGATQANPIYNTGNRVEHCIINDQFDGDGFSWSFQSGGIVRDITHTGSRIAIYICENCVVERYDFTPGTHGSTNGWYITAPSDNITIRDFTSHADVNGAQGGVISQDPTYKTTNVVLDRLTLLGSSNAYVQIGDVDGLDLITPNLEQNNSLLFEPQVKADHVRVLGGQVPQVSLNQGAAIPVDNLEFTGVHFPAFTAAGGQSPDTFINFNNGPTAIRIRGGRMSNADFSSGSGYTFDVAGLNGYNPRGSLTAPSIPASGTAYTNNFGVAVRVFISGGTVSAIAINGTGTGLTSGPITLAPGETITLTYTAAPTWTWFGL